MKRSLTALVFGTILVWAGYAGSESVTPPEGPLDTAVGEMLDGAVGSVDPGVFARLATRISSSDLLVAIYRGDRSQRLVALAVSSRLENPWPVLPYLAVLMRSPERQLASSSGGALLLALESVAVRPEGSPEVVPGQVDQLAEILGEVIADERIALDLRVSAMEATGTLSRITRRKYDLEMGLLEDPEAEIRGAAMAILTLPLEDKQLQLLVGMTSSEADPGLRGMAAGLLCENALSHGIDKPSRDLNKVLLTTIQSAKGVETVAPILGCLARFSSEARAGLVGAALTHPDPAIGAYWDQLQN